MGDNKFSKKNEEEVPIINIKSPKSYKTIIEQPTYKLKIEKTSTYTKPYELDLSRFKKTNTVDMLKSPTSKKSS